MPFKQMFIYAFNYLYSLVMGDIYRILTLHTVNILTCFIEHSLSICKVHQKAQL